MRELPAGIAIAHDIQKFAPGFEIRTIFDIGANEGQSALQFAGDFPKAKIHSFEPATRIYEKLRAKTAHLPNVQCHNYAIGAETSEKQFVVKNLVSHIMAADESVTGQELQTVQVRRLSEVSEQLADRISLLKIDTEGHDFEVLLGGESLFDTASVDLVIVEAGLYPENDRHVPMRRFQDWFEERGYCLFGIYEQTHEFTGEPLLRRGNVAFISPEVRRKHRRF